MALPPRSEDAGQGKHEAASLLKGEEEERTFPWQKKLFNNFHKLLAQNAPPQRGRAMAGQNLNQNLKFKI